MSSTGEWRGFDTGLNWSDPERIDPGEAERLRQWYAETHGEGDLELTPFVPFVIEHIPGGFKRYRRHVQTLSEPPGELPAAVVTLLFLHHYLVIGNERGILYEIIAARDAGVRKQDVLNVLEFAFLYAAPFGLNAAALRSNEYLRDWDERTDGPATPWPDTWSAAPVEVDPEQPYAVLLGRYRPGILETTRARYEGIYRNMTLPPQLLPLLELHEAVIQARPANARAATLRARQLGVTLEQVVTTIGWGFLYASEATMNVTAEAVLPLLDDWAA
jgi:hypothetical protein